jgi:putative N6-adenine-specific DNA methylase
LIAKNIPPGIFRDSFAFEKWKDFDADLWRKVIHESKEQEIKKPAVKITGTDRSVPTLNIAKQNVINAGVNDIVELHQIPFGVYTPSPGPGTVIINPPYGERLVENDIRELYKTIGDYLKKKYGGYQAWILTANREAAKSIGLHPSKKIQLYNGQLECRFLKFELYEGSKKAKYGEKDVH